MSVTLGIHSFHNKVLKYRQGITKASSFKNIYAWRVCSEMCKVLYEFMAFVFESLPWAFKPICFFAEVFLYLFSLPSFQPDHKQSLHVTQQRPPLSDSLWLSPDSAVFAEWKFTFHQPLAGFVMNCFGLLVWSISSLLGVCSAGQSPNPP